MMPKRQYRKRLTVISVITAAFACVMIGTMNHGAHSHPRLVPFTSSQYWLIVISGGGIKFQITRFVSTLQITPGQSVGPTGEEYWRHAGLSYSRWESASFENGPAVKRVLAIGTEAKEWGFSNWYIFAPLLMLLLYTSARFFKSRRICNDAKRGLCTQCAYDLREHQSPNSRCPECGTPIPSRDALPSP